MTVSNPGESAKTELDLTSTERQPDPMLPGRNRLRIGFKNFNLDWQTYDLPAAAVVGMIGLALAVFAVCSVYGVLSFSGTELTPAMHMMTGLLAFSIMVVTLYLAKMVGKKMDRVVIASSSSSTKTVREGRTLPKRKGTRQQRRRGRRRAK